MPTTENTSRFLRLKQIIGSEKTDPILQPLIPISASSWWAGDSSGRFPKPVKLGPNTTAWRWEDIRDLLDDLAAETQR